jgi:putative NIF3 family GTP cyclohydrolase 1 type 2
VEALEKRSDLEVDGAGLGRIGDLPDPMRLSKMTERVKAIFGAERIGVVGRKDRRIRRVAVVGGAGGKKGLICLSPEIFVITRHLKQKSWDWL